MSRTIIVTVSSTGETSIEAKGFVDKTCEDATAFLEKALGERATQTKKPEYHQDQKGQRGQQHLFGGG